MVIKSLSFLALLSLLVACNNEAAKDTPEESTKELTNSIGVSPNEVDGAALIPLEEVAFDSLRLHLKVHDRYTYRIRMNTNMMQDSNALVKKEELLINQEVTKVEPNGDVVVRTLYKKMNIDAKMLNRFTHEVIGENLFNSTDSASRANPRTQQFVALMDSPIDITISPKALIADIKGADIIAKNVISKTPAQSGGKGPGAEQIAQLEEMIKQNMISTFVATTLAPMPDSVITKGGEWTRTQNATMNPVMSTSSVTTFKVINVKKVKGHRIATVEGILKGSIKLNKPPQGIPSPTIKLKSSTIEGTSTVVVDLDSGVLISNKAKALSVIEGTASMPGQPTQTISQRQELEVDTELQP